MAHVIAMAGKGGVGKTTLCGLLIQYLCETGRRPVLAVDADANSNLNEVLGVEVESTLGEIREEIERAGTNALPVGMQKNTWAEMRLNDALVEDDDFDLLVMGRTQGQGCYCFVNGLLQTQMQKLEGNYPYIVVDNGRTGAYQPGPAAQHEYDHLGQRLLPPGCPGCWQDRTAH